MTGQDKNAIYPSCQNLKTERRIFWQDRSIILSYLRFVLFYDLCFFPVYFGADAVASRLGYRFHLYWDWETRIPLIPWMIWPYVSLYLVFLAPLFTMAAPDIRRLTVQTLIGIAIAGVGFILLPAQLSFPSAHVGGLSGELFALVSSFDTTANLVPSLHVLASTLILSACWDGMGVGLGLRFCLQVWLVLIVGSVIFAHQHHLLDVIGGLAIAAAIKRLVPLHPRNVKNRI